MAISIVADKTVSPDRLLVFVESDSNDPNVAREELEHADARRMALTHAGTKGLSVPGVDGFVEIYPVNIHGLRLDEIQPGQKDKRGKPEPVMPAAWRAQVAVQGRPV
jgi:hypothetical protein